MAQLGFRTMDEMIGRVDRLDVRRAVHHWKAAGIDLSALLFQPAVPATVARRRTRPQAHGLERALDHELIRESAAALDERRPVELHVAIGNAHRAVGTLLGSEITRRFGAAGLPDDRITINFTGSAGQSFGAFLPRGVTLRLEGDANDGWGKGLSGGKLAILPPAGSPFAAEGGLGRRRHTRGGLVRGSRLPRGGLPRGRRAASPCSPASRRPSSQRRAACLASSLLHRRLLRRCLLDGRLPGLGRCRLLGGLAAGRLLSLRLAQRRLGSARLVRRLLGGPGLRPFGRPALASAAFFFAAATRAARQRRARAPCGRPRPSPPAHDGRPRPPSPWSGVPRRAPLPPRPPRALLIASFALALLGRPRGRGADYVVASEPHGDGGSLRGSSLGGARGRGRGAVGGDGRGAAAGCSRAGRDARSAAVTSRPRRRGRTAARGPGCGAVAEPDRPPTV